MLEFTPWPKTPRAKSDYIITEKIDGTNSAIIVKEVTDEEELKQILPPFYLGGAAKDPNIIAIVFLGEGGTYFVGAQSRKRLITVDRDNFGFAKWVDENAVELVKILGEGTHYGEWWGSGIQRGYGKFDDDKVFSLFNVNRYMRLAGIEDLQTLYRKQQSLEGLFVLPSLSIVPLLTWGGFGEAGFGEVADAMDDCIDALVEEGSQASPGYGNPEGIVMFHKRSRQVFKAYCPKKRSKGI